MARSNKVKKINPVAAGMAGAVVGAVGSAVAIALSDKSTRKKVGEKMHGAKKMVNKQVHSLQQQAGQLGGVSQKGVHAAKKKRTAPKKTTKHTPEKKGE